MSKFIRVGDRLINLANVAYVELDWDDEGGVAIDLNIAVSDEFNRDDEDSVEQNKRRGRVMSVVAPGAKARPVEFVAKSLFFDGEEAEALTRFFSDEANVAILC